MDTWVHIVGGGLSGLSLASALAKHQVLPGPVVISEPEPERLAQKTFSFWLTDEEHAFLNPNTLNPNGKSVPKSSPFRIQVRDSVMEHDQGNTSSTNVRR